MQPDCLSKFEERLAQEHSSLSRRLKEVSDFVRQNPQALAVDTAAEIAVKAQVHASTLIRFANHFEFNGFSELQKLYKAHVSQAYDDYGERIRSIQQSMGEGADSPVGLLAEFTEANQLSLHKLRNTMDPVLLEQAVQVLDHAIAIHVCGMGRAFPVSMYFAYTLGHMQLQCQAISGLGLMHDSQANSIAAGDALIAITFSPYSQTTQSVIDTAHQNGASIILITGDGDCPSMQLADVMFTVQDAEVRSFRSLTSSMCLAQTLCIALGYRRESAEIS